VLFFSTSSSVFLPFGAGVAYCPGRRFVRNEIKIFMIFLVLNLDLELVDPKKVPEIDGSRAGIGIFPPKDDISIKLKLRN
jgi:cytochrome P450